MMALLSPAASAYLEPLAQRAQTLTRQRFGNTVSFYVPLYLSNLCANDCTYCGFSMSNRIKRKTLNETDIIRECAAIRELGFEHLLLVTGEHQAKVGMDYFRRHLPTIRQQFSSLQMEVQPLAEAEYAELKTLGLDGVMVYQETYHDAMYAQHHLKGRKQDFFWRLETPDRLGRAGIDKIGLGALIGLSDNWRVDCYMVAEHLLWLQQHYWQSRYSISFPRLRPCAGGIEPASIMDERQLVQTICAFRLLAPEIELSLSTRESPRFRDHVIRWRLTTSARSRKPSLAGMRTIILNWNSSRHMTTAVPKLSPMHFPRRGFSRYGKTGMRIWGALRKGDEPSCKRVTILRAATKERKREVVVSLSLF